MARGRGQPTKLTPELQTQIVEALKLGAPIDTACEAAGIEPQTYRNWMRWGREGKGLDGRPAPPRYREFFAAVTRARAQAELMLLARARSGDPPATSNGRAKCAQWLLEHTRPQKYAARLNVRIEEAVEGLLDDVERVSAGKDCGCLEAILERIASRGSGEAARGEERGETPEADPPIH